MWGWEWERWGLVVTGEQHCLWVQDQTSPLFSRDKKHLMWSFFLCFICTNQTSLSCRALMQCSVWHIGFIQSEQRSAGIRSHGVSVWKVSSSLQFQCLESVYVQVFYWNESTVIQANSCNVQIQRFAILSHPPSILLIRSFHISLVFDWIWFRSNS